MARSAPLSPPQRAATIWTALIPVALLLSGCEDAISPPKFLAPALGANSTNSTNSTSAGWCTEEDKQKMDELGYGHDSGNLGGKVYQCARGSVNWLLQINDGAMKDCLRNDVGLSDGCAACFAYASEEGGAHCKMECMGSWCSKSCQECNEKQVSSSWMEQCTGYAIPQPPPC